MPRPDLRVDIPKLSSWRSEVIGSKVHSTTPAHVVFEHGEVFKKAPLSQAGVRANARENKVYGLLKLECLLQESTLVLPSYGTELHKLTLNDITRFGGFLHLAMHVVRAVRRLHLVGYAHRDVKSCNILCDVAKKQVTLIDFEDAKLLTAELVDQDFCAVGFALMAVFERPEVLINTDVSGRKKLRTMFQSLFNGVEDQAANVLAELGAATEPDPIE